MLRAMAVVVMAGAGIVGLAIGQEDRRSNAPAPNADMIPDPEWKPKAGDTASTYAPGGDEVLAAVDYSSLRRFLAILKSKDSVGLRLMFEDGTAIRIRDRSEVLVLEAGPVDGINVVNVRVMQGEHNEKRAWLIGPSVVRLVEKPAPVAVPAKKPPSPSPTPKAVAPQDKAAGLLLTAKALEKAGKVKPAVESYRRIAKEYPGTAAAKEAADRLAILAPK